MVNEGMGFCEREHEMVAEVISGTALHDDLRNHAHSSAVCSQALDWLLTGRWFACLV
jgi:hypothetical protein